MKSPPMYVGSLYFHYSLLQHLCERGVAVLIVTVGRNRKRCQKTKPISKIQDCLRQKRLKNISISHEHCKTHEIITVFYTYILKIYYI